MSRNSQNESEKMVLAGRLAVPADTAALLWDMDGVLLDTLTFDYQVVNALIDKRVAQHPTVMPQLIQQYFAYDISEFWRQVLRAIAVTLPADELAALITEYNVMRKTAAMPVHAGVVEILRAARQAGVGLAVVSNNSEADVISMVSRAGLGDFFDTVIGNDRPGLAKKPAPDPYLTGARELGVAASRCVAVEDSLVGAQAGHGAGCTTVGVATGANTFAELSQSRYVSYCYHDFAAVSAS